MSSIGRVFIRSYGAVIPETAIGTIMFHTWNETSYELDRSERVINPMVHTIETVYASATITLNDADVIKQLFPEESDEDEEDEEEEEKPKRRGRPSKRAVVEEPTVEPVELEIVFYQNSVQTNSEPLNVSTPLMMAAEISDKNERVINKTINHYGALFTQLESIRDNLNRDVENASTELSAAVNDMMPGNGDQVAGLQQSALEEYRSRQRRQEARIVAEIDATLDKFASIIKKRSEQTEPTLFTKDLQIGDVTEPVIDVVNKFFTTELISME